MGSKRIINDQPLTCTHCGGQSFDEREAQLHTAGMTFFKLDWLNKSATIFVCADCGRMEWFLDVGGG